MLNSQSVTYGTCALYALKVRIVHNESDAKDRVAVAKKPVRRNATVNSATHSKQNACHIPTSVYIYVCILYFNPSFFVCQVQKVRVFSIKVELKAKKFTIVYGNLI
jgi:hypothetical protein